MSFGHLVIWSFSHLFIKSKSNLVIGIFSHLIIKAFGYLIISWLDHLIILSFGHLIIWSLSHYIIISFVHYNMQTSGFFMNFVGMVPEIMKSFDALCSVLREYKISQKWANFKKWPQILDKPLSGTLLSGKSPIKTQSVKKNPVDGLKN